MASTISARSSSVVVMPSNMSLKSPMGNGSTYATFNNINEHIHNIAYHKQMKQYTLDIVLLIKKKIVWHSECAHSFKLFYSNNEMLHFGGC